MLRCCERLGLSEQEFQQAGYAAQIRWLAYELLRDAEEKSIRATRATDVT